MPPLLELVAGRLEQGRDVALDELVLQGERRGGDHDPVAVQQRRDEVAQRLAGAGAGLDEQVALVLHRGGDRLGHRDLAGALLAAELLDRGGQHLAHVDHASTLCGRTDERGTARTGGPERGQKWTCGACSWPSGAW